MMSGAVGGPATRVPSFSLPLTNWPVQSGRDDIICLQEGPHSHAGWPKKMLPGLSVPLSSAPPPPIHLRTISYRGESSHVNQGHVWTEEGRDSGLLWPSLPLGPDWVPTDLCSLAPVMGSSGCSRQPNCPQTSPPVRKPLPCMTTNVLPYDLHPLVSLPTPPQVNPQI